VLIQLHQAWVGFFQAMAEWREHPEKFVGRPQLPKYKHKTEGRNLLVYEKGAISKRALKRGMLSLTTLGELVKTLQKKETLVQARVVPRGTHYVIEVVYERKEEQASVDLSLFAALDLGVSNLAAITSNKPGFVPVLVNGRVRKRDQPRRQQATRTSAKAARQGEPLHVPSTRADHRQAQSSDQASVAPRLQSHHGIVGG
jgi:putative transposase